MIGADKKPVDPKAAAPLKRRRKEWRYKKVLRVMAYGAFVSLGVGLVAARSVYGDVKDAALSMGHELGKLEDVGKGRPIRLNGQPIHVAVQSESIPVKEVLDTMEQRCREGSFGVLRDYEDLSPAARMALPAGTERSAAGIIREDRATSGVVACFARDTEDRQGIEATMDRVSDFLATGDLAKLGKLRYVFAELLPSGKTRIVAAWTEGSFNIYALAPEGGDAPGNDVPGAPRPPNAVRLLTADVEGVPYGFRIYDSASSPDAVVAHYDAEMVTHGWEPILGLPGDGAHQRVFTRGGADLMILVEPDGARSVINVIETRAR